MDQKIAPALRGREKIGARAAAGDYVTLMEILELTRPFEGFAHVVRAVVRRLETEGLGEPASARLSEAREHRRGRATLRLLPADGKNTQ